jgi:apolipoprotein N-acyltransferase
LAPIPNLPTRQYPTGRISDLRRDVRNIYHDYPNFPTKSSGWYLFLGFIGLGVLGFFWAAILPFLAGGGFDRFSIIIAGMSLTLATLLSLFFIFQVKYWRRRSTSPQQDYDYAVWLES